jgi:hypothetical protein
VVLTSVDEQSIMLLDLWVLHLFWIFVGDIFFSTHVAKHAICSSINNGLFFFFFFSDTSIHNG